MPKRLEISITGPNLEEILEDLQNFVISNLKRGSEMLEWEGTTKGRVELQDRYSYD